MERFLKMKIFNKDLQWALFKTNEGKLSNHNPKLPKI